MIQKRLINNGSLCYIQIPKCGCSTMREILRKDLKWKGAAKGDFEYFAIVRNPIDRWVSGIITYFGSHLRNMNFNELVKKAWHDKHTCPQSLYLEEYKTAALFDLKNIKKLWIWLTDRGISHSFTTHKNPVNGELKEYIQTILTKDHVRYLKGFYRDDILLQARAR